MMPGTEGSDRAGDGRAVVKEYITQKCEITESKRKAVFQLLKCGDTCNIWSYNQDQILLHYIILNINYKT